MLAPLSYTTLQGGGSILLPVRERSTFPVLLQASKMLAPPSCTTFKVAGASCSRFGNDPRFQFYFRRARCSPHLRVRHSRWREHPAPVSGERSTFPVLLKASRMLAPLSWCRLRAVPSRNVPWCACTHPLLAGRSSRAAPGPAGHPRRARRRPRAPAVSGQI